MIPKSKITHNDLGFLSEKEQRRIVKNMILNTKFFVDIVPIINEKAFSDTNVQKLVKIIITNYKETGFIPNFKDIEILIRDRTYSTEELKTLRNTFVSIRDVDKEPSEDGTQPNTEVLLDTAKRFFHEVEMRKVLEYAKTALDSRGFVEDIYYETIDRLQRMQFSKVVETEITSIDDDYMLETLSLRSDDMIPTEIPELDSKMNGGLAKGNTGLVIAGTGAGKTTLASIFCCNAALSNYKVLQIFFEDLNAEIYHKYYAHLTGYDTRCFKDLTESQKKEYTEIIFNSHPNAKNALKNNVKLVRLENGNTQVEDIQNLVNRLIKIDNWKPDMIFIDYLSCLRPSSNKQNRYDNECVAMEMVMKKLDAFAKSNNIAIWIAQQTNRTGGKDENLKTPYSRMSTLQGSYRVIQPATRVIFLDRVNGTFDKANLYLDKARNAETGAWENITLDNAHVKIDLSGTVEVEDMPDFMQEQEKLNEVKNEDLKLKIEGNE